MTSRELKIADTLKALRILFRINLWGSAGHQLLFSHPLYSVGKNLGDWISIEIPDLLWSRLVSILKKKNCIASLLIGS